MQQVSVYEEHPRQVAYKWPQGGPTVQARRRSLTTFRATGALVTHERGQDPEVDLTFYKVKKGGGLYSQPTRLYYRWENLSPEDMTAIEETLAAVLKAYSSEFPTEP